MTKRLACLLVTLTVSSLLLPPLARCVIIERVVAVVNDQVITLTELQERAILIRQATHNPNIPLKEILKQIIIETIEVQRAKKLGLDVPDEVVEDYIKNFKKDNNLTDEDFQRLLKEWGISLDAYKREIKRRILISKLVNLEVKSHIAVPEEEVKEYYEKNKDKLYLLSAKARIADIFLPWGSDKNATMKLAREIYQKIQLGESFAKLAALYSKGPNAQNGGDMGWVRKGELVAELDKFIFDPHTKKGDVKLLETPQGIHIIKILDRQYRDYVPFDKVKGEIEKKLYKERAQERYKTWLEDLVKKAYVKVLL